MSNSPSYAPGSLPMSAQGSEKRGPGQMPKRRLRNYLLDRRFQLKYAGMVVGVTLVVSSALGYYAYHHSKGQTEALSVQMAMQPDLDPEVQGDLRGWARAQDQKVALAIAFGILILAVAIGATAIVVTHRVVGPAFRLKRTFADVASGPLVVRGRLRKGDELQDVFEAFESLVTTLRERRETQAAELDKAIDAIEAEPREARAALVRIREAMTTELNNG